MRKYIFEELDSTNNFLRDKKDLQEYDLVVARTQTSGKGRRGNQWRSDEGAALFSFALKKDKNLDLKEYRKLPLVAGLSVLKGLSDLEDLEFQFKWTNDVYVGGKKISGILVEMIGDFFIIGIGINVNNKEFGELSERATSLSLETGKEYDIQGIVMGVVNEFKLQYGRLLKGEWSELKSEMNCLNYLKGRRVSVQLPDRIIDGIAGDIVEDGMLELNTGVETMKLDIGEVHIKF